MANVRFCELQDTFAEGSDREEPQFIEDNAPLTGSYALETLASNLLMRAAVWM